MGFVYEEVPKEDIDFLRSMGFKNCWGNNPKYFSSEGEMWSANKEKNAYIIEIGGGMHELPLMFDLWWNGSIVRIEYDERGTSGNALTGIDMAWHINRIIVPKDLWDKLNEVAELVSQGFSVIYWALTKENTKSITVIINCQPELATERDAYGS